MQRCSQHFHNYSYRVRQIIAAYTPNPWKSYSTYSIDSTNSTFLLSLDLKQKMTITSNQYATYNRPNRGSCFGGGHDIYISDKCNANTNSYSSFPTSFNCNDLYSKGQASYTAFCGATNEYNYKVLEYEVFRVIH